MSAEGSLGFVCGLASEARCLKKAEKAVGRNFGSIKVSGASATRAYEAALLLAEERPRALISFGIAGALSSSLKPGDIVLADSVFSMNAPAISASPAPAKAITNAAEAAGFTLATGTILSVEHVLAAASDKHRLFEETGALAVDMESYEMARAAQDHGLPFAVLRAVADPADMSIPESALRSVGTSGEIAPWAAIRGLLTHSGDIGRLIRLGHASAAAHKSLSRAAHVLIPALF